MHASSGLLHNIWRHVLLLYVGGSGGCVARVALEFARVMLALAWRIPKPDLTFP